MRLTDMNTTYYAKSRVFGIFFYFLAKTGLRPSEAIPLLVPDLDLEAGVGRVRKAWASGRVRPCTKTGYSRVVDLSRELVAVLRIYLASLREAALRLGRRVELLFPSEAWSLSTGITPPMRFTGYAAKRKSRGSCPQRICATPMQAFCFRDTPRRVTFRNNSGTRT